MAPARGLLADSIGIKKAVGMGAVVLAVGSALRGISSGYPALLGFTMVYGLGLGICFPNLPKLARHCTPRARSNITLGMFSAAILASGAVSLAVARSLIYPVTHSYQGVFFFSSVPAIGAAALWWLFIDDPPCRSAGVQAASLSLAALRRTLRRPGLLLVAGLFLLHNLAIYTILAWTPPFLRSIGASSASAGWITSVLLCGGILSVLVLTRVSTRLGRRKPFLWGASVAPARRTGRHAVPGEVILRVRRNGPGLTGGRGFR